MLTQIRNELLKLRTVRTPLLLLGVANLVVVAGISGLFVSGADPRAARTVLGAVGHVGLVSTVSLILGIVIMAGEYRHHTITDTYLAQPRRGQVVAAKLVTAMLAALGLAASAAVTALVVTAIWLSAKGTSLDLSTVDLWRSVVGAVLWNVAFAAIGVGVGALVRNLVGAVAAALVWVALVEGIAGQLLGGLGRWLPFASGSALELNPMVTDRPAQWAAGLALVGYAVAFAGLAVSTSVRRDVT